MITRRDFIKGMGALALCVSLPMAAGATVTPRIGYYDSFEYMADSVNQEALSKQIAGILNAPNAIFEGIKWKDPIDRALEDAMERPISWGEEE